MITAAVVEQVEELMQFLDPEERAIVQRNVRRIVPKPKGVPVPANWRARVPVTFPRYATAPFGRRHEEFWAWAESIELDSSPDPFVGIWPRGGGKSTTAEMVVADLGCRNKRKYVLYVRATQLQADKSVANIATLLESDEVARHYPEHADRSVGKFGNSKGWKREQLRTKGGFTVDAIGLDTAARGAKVDEQRPDFIVFDDIDELLDTPQTTAKKEETITKSILPAGSNNCAVAFIQNLIKRDGIAARLAGTKADYLALRDVSGPFPAVDGLEYQWMRDEKTGKRRVVITKGTATWAGQPIEVCERQMNTWGASAFLKEAQHKVQGKALGVSLKFDDRPHPDGHYVDLDDEQTIELVRASKCFAGIDPQWWRFGFTLWCVTTDKIVVRVAEMFSQAEVLAVRARKIHELCLSVGLIDPSPRTCPIWADAANPQDIAEMNKAFKDGWLGENGVRVTSRLRVVKVANENKLRRVAVQRINNALDAHTLLFRRSVGQGDKWFLGQNAGNEGVETEGSRLMWEIENWAVVQPKEGEAQDENPDDDTADGADMIATARYALMSHWRAGVAPVADEVVEDARAEHFDVERRKFVEYPHALDELERGNNGRRAPAVRGPRPRIGRR